jgi:hypothetical protein
MTPIAMHWITSLPQVAAGSFVSDLWQGSILAVGVWLCLRILPRVTAAIRFAVWTAVFVVLALRPLLQSYMARSPQPLPVHAALLRIDVRWCFAIAGLWVALSLVRVVKLLVSGFQLHGIWKRAVPVSTEQGEGVLLAKAGWRTAQLCTSRDVDCPSVIGFFSPRVLIPEEMFGRLAAAEMEQIVLHEMGHLRRGDDWINLLQKLGLVLFPLNPVLMWIERRLCFERELACDEDVLRQTRAPKAYATCLMSLAERRLDRRAVSLSLGVWERQSELARRVHSILRRGEGMGRTQARVALGAIVLALMGGATELSRCPRIVSFTSSGPRLQNAVSALPVAAYQPVVSHPMAGAHESLLKASMPSTYARSSIGAPRGAATVRRRSRRMNAPMFQRTKQHRVQVQQWVVLTSWGQPVGISRMLLTVPSERGFVPSYAAVPTDAGWLVIQL